MSLERIKSDLHKLPMFSQQRFASPHSQKHLLPTLVALRPDPAAESCVDPQLLTIVLSALVFHILFQDFVL